MGKFGEGRPVTNAVPDQNFVSRMPSLDNNRSTRDDQKTCKNRAETSSYGCPAGWALGEHRGAHQSS